MFLLTAHFLNKKTIKMKQEIIKAIQDTLVIIGGGKGLPYYMAGFFFRFLQYGYQFTYIAKKGI